MKSRTRYSLIALGITSFIVLAPFIVFFVSGIKYDFQSKRFIETGFLSARTNPKDAKLYLNGKLEAMTPATERFLTPGDYEVKIHKEGYFDWNKRLNIKAQYVTYVHEDLSALVLFRHTPERQKIENNILDFVADNKKIVYAKGDKVFASDLDKTYSRQELELPRTFSELKIIGWENQNYYLLQGQDYNAIFDTRENKIYDLSELSGTGTFELQRPGYIFYLENGSLYEIGWEEQERVILLDGVVGMKAVPGALYYIQNRSLMRFESNNLQNEILLENLPQFQSAEILITNQNQIFILADQRLYSVGNGLDLIAEYVRGAKIDNPFRALLYWTGNEVNSYSLSTGTTSLITRTSYQISNPQAFFNIGWMFYSGDNRLQNIEFDTRGHQNNYTFANISPSAKYHAGQDGRYLFLLDNGVLERLVVR